MSTITINGSDPCTYNFLESAVVNLRAGGPDEFTMTFGAESAKNDSLPFSFNDSVTVVIDGKTVFDGRIVTPSRNAGGASESFSLTAQNGWGDMAAVTLQQPRKSYKPSDDGTYGSLQTTDCPIVTLGQNENGTNATTGDVFEQIIDWAASKGANITKGSIISGRLVNQAQVIDVKCAQALRNYLRFHPSATAWIDNGDELNIKKTTELDSVSFDTENDCVRVNATSRQDRQAKGVEITYKIAHNVDGGTLIEFVKDSAGSTNLWPPAVVFTVELPGTSVTYQKQEMETRTLPNSGDLDSVVSKRFFKGIWPFLEAAADGDLEIRDYKITPVNPRLDELDFDTQETKPGGESNAPYVAPDPAQYPRQVVSGKVQEWMQGVKQHPATIEAKVYYKGSDADILKQLDQVGKTGGIAYRFREMNTVIDMTDAFTKEYREIDSFEPSQIAPIAGLAQDYFNAINLPSFEGAITGNLATSEKLLKARPGARVSVANVAPSSSPITDWSVELLTQSVEARFGLSEYLNPKDLVALGNVTTVNQPNWSTAESRTEAKPALGVGGFGGRTGNGGRAYAPQDKPVPQPLQAWDLIDTTDYSTPSPTVKVDLIVGNIRANWDRTGFLTIEDVESFQPTVGDSIYVQIEYGLDGVTIQEITIELGDLEDVKSCEFTGGGLLAFSKTELWKFVEVDDPDFSEIQGIIYLDMKAVKMVSATSDMQLINGEFYDVSTWRLGSFLMSV